MPVYISLLRGINVGAQKKIAMKDLKALYEAAGFTSVQTYIQTGNVVFSTPEKNKQQIAAQIEKQINDHYGFDVAVVVLTPADLEKIIKANPFLREEGFEEGKMYVCFLKQKPAKELAEKIKDIRYGDDRFQIIGNVIYLFVPGGYGVTKLNNNFFEAKLKVAGTTRNWNTVNKLKVMAG